MLAGHAPALFAGAGGFLDPSAATGNDSYTVSLLHCDGSDAQIGTPYLIDSAHAVPSRKNQWTLGAGTPRLAASPPFNQAMYFPGNGFFTCPYADDLIPTGDFTIDFYFYSSTGEQIGTIIGICPPTGCGPWAFVQGGTGQYSKVTNLQFYASSNGSSYDMANGLLIGSISTNTYNHIALSRKGATWYAFLNGQLSQSWTDPTPFFRTVAPLQLGGGLGSYMNGLVDEVRISNGIARWTATFVPQTSPYYDIVTLGGGNDVATKLLLHFDGNLTDSAKGSLSQPRVFTNYGANFGGSGAAIGSTAIGFAAPGQRVTCPDSSELNFNNSDFTIDFWFYRSLAGAVGDIVGKRAGNADLAPYLFSDQGNGTILYLGSNSGSSWNINQVVTSAAPLNVWMHLAAVRRGSDFSLYYNGNRTAQYNLGGGSFWQNGSVLSIGGNSSASVHGYVEELRICDVARWAGPFAPPIAPY
jgi:hypothetical protein